MTEKQTKGTFVCFEKHHTDAPQLIEDEKTGFQICPQCRGPVRKVSEFSLTELDRIPAMVVT